MRHLQTVKSLSKDLSVEMAAVCDVWDKRKLQAQAAARLPTYKVYKDYRKLLDDKDIDAVIIAVPEHWHARMAIDALEAGKDVYLEKPMTRRLDEALKLLDTAKKSKQVVQIGAQACSSPVWRRAGDLIREGRIGKKVWSQASYCRNSRGGEWNYEIDLDATPAFLDWDAWLGPCKKRPWDPERYFRWRKYTDYSSGIISDLLPHKLSPLLIALGPEYPERVTCIGSTITQRDREVADNVQVLVEFPSGHTVLLAGSTCNAVGIDDAVRGNKGSIYFSDNRIDLRPERPYTDEVEPLQEEVEGPGGSIEDHLRNFFECVRSREKPNCDVELAAKVQVIISLAEKSWLEGKTMLFDTKRLSVVE